LVLDFQFLLFVGCLMKISRLLLTLAIICGGAAMLPAVEMFTHYSDGSRIGFESLNATKKSYPGYLLPNGQRMPVAAPYFYPANGAHPWNWHVMAKPMVGLPLHGAAPAPAEAPHNPYSKLPIPAPREVAPFPAKVPGHVWP
jgi:hypothetical protein